MGIRERFRRLLEEEKDPRRLARGFVVGTAIGVTPTVGVQTALALLFSLILRGSPLAAVAATFIVNPVGYIPPGPWVVANYYVGAAVLGQEPIPLSRFREALAPKGEEFEFMGAMRRMARLGLDLLLPISVGAGVCAAAAALLSHLILQRIIRKKKEPQQNRQDPARKEHPF